MNSERLIKVLFFQNYEYLVMNPDSRSIEFCKDWNHQDEYIRQLERFLARGGKIDLLLWYCDNYGTVLAHALLCGFNRIVQYVLEKGANITADFRCGFCNIELFNLRNAIEIALYRRNFLVNGLFEYIKSYDMLKGRCLKLFSSHGLTSFHIDCAVGMDNWSCKLEDYLKTVDVNATVDADSPFWSGMTPLLIAAKFHHFDLVEKLLNFGALPTARDVGGNTALHYLYPAVWASRDVRHWLVDCAKRLFIFDGSDTFGTFTGESHFHIACKLCPEMLETVKKFLEQGISPNLETKKNESDRFDLYPMKTKEYENGVCGSCTVGKCGLHIAGMTSVIPCAELVQLLLEYGADVDRKDADGNVALNYFIRDQLKRYHVHPYDNPKCISLLLESGARLKTEKVHGFTNHVLRLHPMNLYPAIEVLLCSIKKIFMLNRTYASEEIKKVYQVLQEDNAHDLDFDENVYEKLCLEQLNVLSKRGLREVLDATIIKTIKSDFKKRFKALVDSDDLQSEQYPIYGRMLKIQIKRNLFLYEEKRRKIKQAI